MGKKNLSIYHKVAFFLYPPAINTQENDIYKIKNFILTKMEELYFSYFSQQTPTSSDIARLYPHQKIPKQILLYLKEKFFFPEKFLFKLAQPYRV